MHRKVVPATSANLGPGYDSLGLALGLYDVVVAEVLADGLEITVDGEGAGHIPLDHEHLVVRAVRRATDTWGLPPMPGLRLEAHNAIRTAAAWAPLPRPWSPASRWPTCWPARPGVLGTGSPSRAPWRDTPTTPPRPSSAV